MHLGESDMTLTKCKLGDLIEQCDDRNDELKYSLKNVKGISTQKTFIETKANMNGVSLKPYKLVNPDNFAYVQDTSRRGNKIALAHNTTKDTYIISSVYTVFRVKEKQKIDSDYLFMYFNRPEFDRFSRFNSWGSARETFVWEDMCDIDIELPSLEIQKKYVDVYNAMLANQQNYEQGLNDLKLVCDAYVEELRREFDCEPIGPYIQIIKEKNEDDKIKLFQGVNVEHVFIEPKRTAKDSKNGSIVKNGQFAFNKVMKAHNTKLPIALREGPDCVVSNSYQVFQVIDNSILLPKYLMLWFNRAETQRYMGFISNGTTRDIFTFDDMCEIAIPIPKINVQQDIVDIYDVYQMRININKKLKDQIKNICSILIKGSIEEAKK